MKTLPYIHDSITVTQSMCDHNGHMNVNHYYKLFDSTYTSFYINELGFDEDYIKSGFSTFTLEDSIRYLNEFTLDEKVYPSFILYKANKKLLHFIGILQNEDAELAAIFETVLGHIDLQKRKIVNFSDDKIQHTQDICQKQKEGTDISFEIKLAIKDINE
ncbi:thioesterase family protein [Gammaproteobacteria bacterium]|nr:thioesterase family protein [Gammaproteobacteria bacterium]